MGSSRADGAGAGRLSCRPLRGARRLAPLTAEGLLPDCSPLRRRAGPRACRPPLEAPGHFIDTSLSWVVAWGPCLCGRRRRCWGLPRRGAGTVYVENLPCVESL